MKKQGMRRWTRGEIQFYIINILVGRMDLDSAKEMARLIYTDVVAPAIAEVDNHWEELNRAKDANRLS